MDRRLPGGILATFLAAGSSGCRAPTQVTVEITTDVSCDRGPATTLRVGRLGSDLERQAPVLSTQQCNPTGRIGSVVVVPSGDNSDRFAVQVALGHGGKSPEQCSEASIARSNMAGCIVARRAMSFVPHSSLTLPIAMRIDCDSVLSCGPTETCLYGQCVPATDDPRPCAGDDCPDTGAPDAEPDASIDAAIENATESAEASPDHDARDVSVDDARDVSVVDDTREVSIDDAAREGDVSMDPPIMQDARDSTAEQDACADGACLPGRSCSGLSDKCGLKLEDCCLSPLATGGDFLRANNGALPASVSSFRLDKFEVTVARFRTFVAAVVGGWRPPAGSGKHRHLAGGGLLDASGQLEGGWDAGWQRFLPASATEWNTALACPNTGWTPSAGEYDRRAMNCINWYEAYAFCIWDGGFLPTYTEWNFAASGGKEQRPYPWGSDPPNANNASYCVLPPACPIVPNMVGSATSMYEAFFGQTDLVGNVEEWVLDVQNQLVPCTDCAAIDITVSKRDHTNGSFADGAQNLANNVPLVHSFDLDRSSEIGVRCARPPQ